MRPFNLRITNPDNQNIDFGKRKLGSIGRDVLAVKLALGAIVSAQDVPNQQDNLELIDPNGWLDCTTGAELTPQQAATFDKNMQIRLMKFQLDHQFLIMCYLFHKFGIVDIINQSITKLGYHPRSIGDALNAFKKGNQRSRNIEYEDLSDGGKEQLKEEISLDVLDSMTTMFSNTLGTLDESTLAVMHGWTPQSIYGNKSYYHPRPSGGDDVVLDIIPMRLFEDYINGNLTQKTTSDASRDKIANPSTMDRSYINNSQHLSTFNENAPDSYIWNPANAAFRYATIEYVFHSRFLEDGSERVSPLYRFTMQALEMIEDIPDTATYLKSKTIRDALERAIQPDHKTDPDPFIIDSNRIGFFDAATMPEVMTGTPGIQYTVDNLLNWIADKDKPEVIAHLEDAALRKVLKYYNKPDIWYFYKESLEVQDEYFAAGDPDMPTPEHSNTLPHNKPEEDRFKYWVITTSGTKKTARITDSDEPTVQLWNDIEGQNPNEPLIQFKEYREPSLRPGDPYRAYFIINRKKLDLITDGYYVAVEEAETQQPSSSERNLDQMNALSEQLAAVCETTDPENDDRRYREYRALAAKNRREIVRRIREQSLRAHQSASINRSVEMELGNTLGPLVESFGVNLGPFGTLDLNDGRYAHDLIRGLGAGAMDLFGFSDDDINLEISDGERTRQWTKKDQQDLTKLDISWNQLKQRQDVIKKDLIEAKKHAQEDQFSFQPETFDPAKEAGYLQEIIKRIQILIEQKYGSSRWSGFDTAVGFLDPAEAFSDSELHIDFAFEPEETGPLAGLTTASIKEIRTTRKTIYTRNLSDPNSEPKEFKKKIAVGYLSQIDDMTTGMAGQIAAQVAKDSPGCSDLGQIKNGTAYLIKYTFGLKATLPPGKKKDEKSWYEQWYDTGLKGPLSRWTEKSLKNNANILDPKHFGQDEVLAAIGEDCTWPQLYKEFIDKVNLRALLCDYLKCIGLPGVSIKAPSLNIPPFPKIKIFGWYVGFVKFLMSKWKEIIMRLICTIVRLLIDFLAFPLCDQNFKDAFGNALDDAPVMQKALADALFGLPITPGDEDKAKDFVDDVFRALRADEICRLLEGEPLDGAAMAMLERIAEHNNLNTSFSDRDDILEFFNVIAGFVPTSLCERLSGLDDIVGDATCKDSADALRELRNRFDAQEGDDVTAEQINEALAMARQNLMSNEEAYQALVDNGLADMMGNYLELNNPDALVNSLPETINKSIERTAKHTFERTKMSYISGLASFVPGLSLPISKMARAGDQGFNEQAVIKVEAAMQNLMDYGALSSRNDSQEPDVLDWRFLSLYQVFEGERKKGHLVHKRYLEDGSQYSPGLIEYGSKVTYETFLDFEPSNTDAAGNETLSTRLKVISYASNVIADERKTKHKDTDSGENIDVDQSKAFGAEYVSPYPLRYPNVGMDHHQNGPKIGPFALFVDGEKTKNPQFIPRKKDDDNNARSGWPGPHTGTSLEHRHTWEFLEDTWIDIHLPEWTTFRLLPTAMAKEMYMLKRVQELTDIIQDNLADATGTETNSTYMAILDKIYDSSIEAALETTSEEQIDGISNVKMRMSTEIGPFKPSVVLEEFESTGTRDSFSITVKDSFLFPGSPEGQEFKYCEPVPEAFATTEDGKTLNPDYLNKTLAKRLVFGHHAVGMVGKDLEKYDFGTISIPVENSGLLSPLRGPKTHEPSGALNNSMLLLFGQIGRDAGKSVYNLAFEGILEQIFFKLRSSRMFNEEYANSVHDRLVGRYVLDEGPGCVVNKFNLNHFGILSFDKMVTDMIPDLVKEEMSRPENQPQNLDYNDPGPIEKAIQRATLRAFIRFCLIELMLKGAIPYSLWDMEGVKGDQFFKDYCIRYIETQLNKFVSIKELWGPVAEKEAGVTGHLAALKIVVGEELEIMPPLSRQIYSNKNASYNYIDFLTSDSNNIIPNRNVPKSFQQTSPETDPGMLMWTSEEVVSSNPFLSIEHYIKIDGPVADLSAAAPEPQAAMQAIRESYGSRNVQGEIIGENTLILPGSDQPIEEGGFPDRIIDDVIDGLHPFTHLKRDISSAILDSIDPVPPTLSPIMADSRKNAEIYHIDEVKAMMEVISSPAKGYDAAVGPSFGFTYGPSGLLPSVLVRTPSRFITRTRKMMKLSSADVFDPKKDLIKNLIRLKSQDTSSQINFRDLNNDDILSAVLAQVSPETITSDSERYYIIPTNTINANWQDVTAIGTPEPGPSSGESTGPQANNLWPSRFYRGWTSTRGGHSAAPVERKDPLDPSAWWLSEQIPKFDVVIHRDGDGQEEVLFRNVYGQVDRETFDDYVNKVNDPSWVFGDNIPEWHRNLPEIATRETWHETVIDFVGPASMIFPYPGESMDDAVRLWHTFGLTKARDEWKKLAKYLPDSQIQKILSGRSQDNFADLIAETTNNGDVLQIAPARAMGAKPGRDIIGQQDYRNNTLWRMITDFFYDENRDDFDRPIGGTVRTFSDRIARSLNENDYMIPMRLLVTQIEMQGQIKQVFARFVLPETVSSTRTSESSRSLDRPGQPGDQMNRAQRLDEALASIFREYTLMIELAFAVLPSNLKQRDVEEDEVHWAVENFRNRRTEEESRRMMTDAGREAMRRVEEAIEIQAAEREEKIHKYITVFKHYRDFPFLVGNLYDHREVVDAQPLDDQPAPIPGMNVKRPKFCSVSKIYSLACEREATLADKIFSRSQGEIDKLFASRGYLMKQNDREIAPTSYPKFYKDAVQNWQLAGLAAIAKLQADKIKVEAAIEAIKNTISGELASYGGSARIDVDINVTNAANDTIFAALDLLPENLREHRETEFNFSNARWDDNQLQQDWNEAESSMGRIATDGMAKKHIAKFFAIIESMIRLFGGQTYISRNAEQNITEGASSGEGARDDVTNDHLGYSRSCMNISNVLDVFGVYGPDYQKKILNIPEPFRTAVTAGCFDRAGNWRSEVAGEDNFERFWTRTPSGIPSTATGEEWANNLHITKEELTNQQYKEFAIFCIKLVLKDIAQARITLHDEIYSYGNTVLKPPAEGERWSRTHVHSLSDGTELAGAVQQSVYPKRNRAVADEELLRSVLVVIHNYLFVARKKIEQRITLLDDGAGADFLVQQEKTKKAKYQYALNLKYDQRTGLNYLYTYRLHDLLSPNISTTLDNVEMSNKIALSVSNMITWFSQKRSESFYGMTSHPANIHPYLRPSARASTYIPMATDERVAVEPLSEEGMMQATNKVKIDFHTETPGVMCGFSPFVGDGRYHLEEFLEAYKQHFLMLNPQANGIMTITTPEARFGTSRSNEHFAPKVAYSYFINYFITTILNVHFIDFGQELEDNWDSSTWLSGPEMSQPHGNLASYRDCKYLGFDESIPEGYGMFESVTDKFQNIKTMLKIYKSETDNYAQIVNQGLYEATNAINASDFSSAPSYDQVSYDGRGVLGTNFALENTLNDVQRHLLKENNLTNIQSSGFPGMNRSQKVFIYHPDKNINIKDHVSSVAEYLTRESFGNRLSVAPGYRIFSDPSNFYMNGFATNMYSDLNLLFAAQITATAHMLRRQWQCMMDDTGLYFFYENYRRIFTESLFDSIETLISDNTSIKDCSRLMLNIPSNGVSGNVLNFLNSNFQGAVEDRLSNDFPESHPMYNWLTALQDHLNASGHPDAIKVLSSEERAYRLNKPGGSGRIFSIPLAKYEDGEDFRLLESGGDIDAMVNRFNTNKYQRTRALFEKEDAKRVVEYIFPFQRYMSLATVYSTSLLGGYNEIPNLMTAPKAGLAIILYLCASDSRTRLDFLEDVNQSEFLKKAMDNMTGLGGNATSCFDFPFNEDLWEQFLEQLVSLIKQMPAIILRGIADVIDPAYKEMKVHYQNCDIKYLKNSGWTSNATLNNANLQSGLMQANQRGNLQGGARDGDSGDGVYVPIVPAIINDVGAGLSLLSLSPFITTIPGTNELRNAMLRMVSYIYKGPASLLDPTMAFKIPCLDFDLDYKEKWNHGKYGRYGHPISPFTLMALATAEINSERSQKEQSCPTNEPPPPDCEDE